MSQYYSSFDILNLSEVNYDPSWYDASTTTSEEPSDTDYHHHQISNMITGNQLILPPLSAQYNQFTIREDLDKMAISSFDFRIIPNTSNFTSQNYKNSIQFITTRTESESSNIIQDKIVSRSNPPPMADLEYLEPSVTNLELPIPSVTNLDFLVPTKTSSSFPTKEEKLNCKHCNEKFSYRNTLNRHMRLHTGEKKHHCTTCKKSFSRKDILLRHRTSQKCRYVKFRETYNRDWVPGSFPSGNLSTWRCFTNLS